VSGVSSSFCNDIPELLKSWQRLIDEGCRTYFPGHGKPISFQKLKVSYEKGLKEIKKNFEFIPLIKRPVPSLFFPLK